MSGDSDIADSADDESPAPVVTVDPTCDLITVTFPALVKWIGLNPKQAWELSSQLNRAALSLESHVPPPKTPGISDNLVWQAMVDHGGHFVRTLGNLYSRADSTNRAKIRVTWSGYWAVYTEMALADREKLKNIENDNDNDED